MFAAIEQRMVAIRGNSVVLMEELERVIEYISKGFTICCVTMLMKGTADLCDDHLRFTF